MAATLLVILSAVNAWAQNIRGLVTDGKTGEPLIGAVVQVKDTKVNAVTDVDGKFNIEGLDNGKYTLTVRYLAYKTKEIDGVQTKASGVENLMKIALDADEQQLKEVTVTAVEKKNTDVAMIQASRNSSVIVSNVSAQEIQRTQDTNAGEVIRRVPGVSLIDDKFVMVRGLSQRYNNVWINGGAVPSSEVDSRAFSGCIL